MYETKKKFVDKNIGILINRVTIDFKKINGWLLGEFPSMDIKDNPEERKVIEALENYRDFLHEKIKKY